MRLASSTRVAELAGGVDLVIISGRILSVEADGVN
jgi:hypothetical protein